ncbi:hypothetical protein L0F63_002508 [Massospora cicadina]|nr:hypothetical protein L0F63_002508 [Massospora cicadina]
MNVDTKDASDSAKSKKSVGPLRIVLEAPKFSEDYSDDENTTIRKASAKSHYESITFSKLKFKGKGSSLFDVLPPPKAQDDKSQEQPQASASKDMKKPPQVTGFVPHTVKFKQAGALEKSQSASEPLFPIGDEIQDTYVNERLIPETLPSEVPAPEASGYKPEAQYYYGYDYSADLYAASQVTEAPALPEDMTRLPREAAKIFGGMRKHDKPIHIQEVNLNKELNSAEAIKARTLHASALTPSSSIKLEYIPTSNQKRTHNIMYLAHQAQMRDAELQEQYAANKLSKRQSQAKYGNMNCLVPSNFLGF